MINSVFSVGCSNAIFYRLQTKGLGQALYIASLQFRLFALVLALVLALLVSPVLSASEKLFLENCAVCHQKDGQGIPKVYPSLVASEVVRGSGVDVALVLMIGRGEMPSFKGALSSEDMASIINYVRGTLAHVDGEITAARIDALQ